MAERQKAKSGGARNRKHGRNNKRCETYRKLNRREVNKLARLKRHIARNARDVARKAKRGYVIRIDKQAISALKRLSA